jgi:hypothetical protein
MLKRDRRSLSEKENPLPMGEGRVRAYNYKSTIRLPYPDCIGTRNDIFVGRTVDMTLQLH